MTTSRDVRKRRIRKARQRPMPPLPLDQRLTRMSLGQGIHVGYSFAMPTGRIDRDAWAREVSALISRYDPGAPAPGNKSAFARRIGITTRTLDRWLDLKVDVSLNSVRAVAEALGMSQAEQVDLLGRIGYFTVPTQGISPPQPVDPREDAVIQRILADPTWTEEERVVLVQREIDRIEREQQQRLQDYEWFLKQRRSAS